MQLFSARHITKHLEAAAQLSLVQNLFPELLYLTDDRSESSVSWDASEACKKQCTYNPAFTRKAAINLRLPLTTISFRQPL